MLLQKLILANFANYFKILIWLTIEKVLKIWYYVNMDIVNQKYYDKFCELETEYDEYFELLCSVEIMSDNKLFEHYRIFNV